MRASGMTRLIIFAVRTLNAAISAGVFFPLRSGSFHIAQSVTRPLKCCASASTHRSHAASPSSLFGKPAPRSHPPAPS